MRTHHLGAVATAALMVFAAQGARGQCCGDCDGNGTVAINELVAAVNNALGECETRGCGLPATGQRTSYGAGSDGDVQAGVPLSATDNGDGTITDDITGLMWEKKDAAGGIHNMGQSYTWGYTFPGLEMNGTIVTEFLSALNAPPCFAGHCDWRIPNIRELQSLVDYGQADPAVRRAFNSNCAPGCTVDGMGGPRCSCNPSGPVWSFTTYQADPSFAWEMNFDHDGHADALRKDPHSRLKVRAVRGGL